MDLVVPMAEDDMQVAHIEQAGKLGHQGPVSQAGSRVSTGSRVRVSPTRGREASCNQAPV